MIKEKLDLDQLTEKQEDLLDTLIFTSKLILFGIILHLILYLQPDTTTIQEIYAAFIANTLTLLGIENTLQGIEIIIENTRYLIVQDCLGWKSMFLITALYFSTPHKIIKNIKHLLYGLIIIQIANVIRVISTIILAELGIISFDIIHDFLWQWGLSIIVIAMWYYWYTKIIND